MKINSFALAVTTLLYSSAVIPVLGAASVCSLDACYSAASSYQALPSSRRSTGCISLFSVTVTGEPTYVSRADSDCEYARLMKKIVLSP